MFRSALFFILLATTALAATSSPSVPSAFGGNGHNASFDGRLFVVRTGPGWQVYLLRPEGITYLPGGMPDATGPMWSPSMQIVDGEPNGENALAICEPDPAKAPYACDANNAPNAAGPFACYDVWLIDSDATKGTAQGGMVFRRRHMLLRVANPKAANAAPAAFTLGPLEEIRTSTNGQLRGIEPTVTKDGKLMLWQGSINNGDQDGTTFGTNDTPSNLSLFQTIDVARVNAPGPVRDAFLAAVTANAPAIAARTWPVPVTFRSTVAEVQPNEKAPLVDLGSLSVPPDLPHALGMIGCPRCHTDDADFVQTGIDRKPSPFYDKELDARAARLDALGRGEQPVLPPFGPLQSSM